LDFSDPKTTWKLTAAWDSGCSGKQPGPTLAGGGRVGGGREPELQKKQGLGALGEPLSQD
jgi:hypothetical protein